MPTKVLIYPIIVATIWFVSDHQFFWDTVQLASKHAQFFYETDFHSLILPEEIDSGHPPIFGMYIAFVWKLWGKSLWVSHLAMLPFLLGIAYLLEKIGEALLGQKNCASILLLCFADPVLLGQLILVSPDIVLVCCFLGALLAIIKSQFWLLCLYVIGLGLISTRGMMVAFALFLFANFISKERWSIKLLLVKALPFLPGGLLAAGYLFYHWQQTGWVGYHENSTWAPSFTKVDMAGFVRNIGVVVWRILDFGRVFVVLAIVAVITFKLKSNGWKMPKFDRHDIRWQLIALTGLLFIALVPLQMQHQGLLAHRYFLPIFLAMSFILAHWVHQIPSRWGRPALFLATIGLATGNFWVYPPKIAMGWDSTLAHLPWYGLQQQVQNYLRENEIPFEEVGTGFPNIGPRDIYELNGVGEGFSSRNLEKDCYIFYSNIMNDFTDEEIDLLHANWHVLFEEEEGGVCVKLFKNPNLQRCKN